MALQELHFRTILHNTGIQIGVMLSHGTLVIQYTTQMITRDVSVIHGTVQMRTVLTQIPMILQMIQMTMKMMIQTTMTTMTRMMVMTKTTMMMTKTTTMMMTRTTTMITKTMMIKTTMMTQTMTPALQRMVYGQELIG